MITEISFIDSLVVTVFSMLVVFTSLLVIAVIINWIRLLSTEDKKKVALNVQPEVTVTRNEQVEVVQTTDNSEELVAVIAAAIAANLGVNTQDINIRTIRRVSQSLTPWSVTNRQEQLYGKL